MAFPIAPPVEPMLARLADTLPAGKFIYEPKWDGFRCIAFIDGDEVELASRNERALTRYFPEVVIALKEEAATRCVLDGEIVIAGPAGLDFDALLQRIHPAASRVERLAQETPASFVAFDLLCLGDEDLRGVPFVERRRLLESSLLPPHRRVHLTPRTTDPTAAADWFARFEGAGLDGVMAKDGALAYREGERSMWKLKHERTADCVVGGFRWHSGQTGRAIGSLLLGLYDTTGVLQHVGVASSFTARRRAELVEELAPLRLPEGGAHPWLAAPSTGAPARPADDETPPDRRPGRSSRWTAKRDLSFEALVPERVCEVAYDHLQGNRFRHATHFVRWRTERDAGSCTYAQLEEPVPAELDAVLGTSG